MFICEQRQLETEEVHGPPPAPALALSPDPRPSSGCSLYKVPGPGTKVWAAVWVPVWLHWREQVVLSVWEPGQHGLSQGSP